MSEKNYVIDADVHPYPESLEKIRSYIPKPWSSRFQGIEKRGMFDNPIHVNRLDAYKPGDEFPCSDPAFVREQLINEYGIKYAILLPRAFATKYSNPDFATMIARGFNDWLADVWLDNNNEDGVFKGSITIAPQDPVQAVKEIDRWAGHPHMIQVMMDGGSRAPYGQRQYHPIYEACERNGLVLAIHPGTEGVGINDSPIAGYPTTYMEWHTGMILAMQTHLISFVTEGVFERFPNLKVALVEGGTAWLPSLLWRMDNEWKAMREEVPWVKKRPSEYVKQHVRLATQPLENPDNKQDLLKNFELMDAENMLMFSSDYPHYDFDNPKRVLPNMPDRMKKNILFENAKRFYNLP